jgi:hypothetical protein
MSIYLGKIFCRSCRAKDLGVFDEAPYVTNGIDWQPLQGTSHTDIDWMMIFYLVTYSQVSHPYKTFGIKLTSSRAVNCFMFHRDRVQPYHLYYLVKHRNKPT